MTLFQTKTEEIEYEIQSEEEKFKPHSNYGDCDLPITSEKDI
jgi:hypothetical protein